MMRPKQANTNIYTVHWIFHNCNLTYVVPTMMDMYEAKFASVTGYKKNIVFLDDECAQDY
jgi:hypothetical protein